MAINLADILNLGLTAYNASQGNTGGAASGLSGILGPIFSSGTAPTTGGQGGGFLSSIFGSDSPVSENPVSEGGGIMNSLGSIFGSSSGPTGYTGPSVWPQVLGSLASSFRATPRAGASREEREKASRYNMLAGILGAVATGYGKASDEAAKQKATSELYQIFTGAAPSTVGAESSDPMQKLPMPYSEPPARKEDYIQNLPMPAGAAPLTKSDLEQTQEIRFDKLPSQAPTPLSRNERLAEFMRQNPAMADVAGKLLAKEQEDQIKRMDIARKAMTGGLREVDLYNIAESRGILPEDRASWVEAEKQRRAQEGLSSLGLFGFGAPKQPASANLEQMTAPEVTGSQTIPTQPTKQQAQQNIIAQDILGKADKGQEFDITVPADQAESVIKGLEQGGYQEQPVTAKPNFSTPEEQRGFEKRQQKETRKKKKENVKAVGEWIDRNKEPFSEVKKQSANAPSRYDAIVRDLMSDDPSVQQNGLTTLLSSRDDSVVQIGELDRFNETVYTPVERLKRQALGFLGKRMPLPNNVRDALIKSARDIRDIKVQAGDAAEESIRKAAIANADEDFSISGLSEYRKNYKSIRDWIDEKNQDDNNSIMSTLRAVETAPKPKRASTPVASAVRTPMVPPIPTTGTTAPETYQYNGKSYIVRRRF